MIEALLAVAFFAAVYVFWSLDRKQQRARRKSPRPLDLTPLIKKGKKP